MKVHNYAEYTLYGWCFSRNFPKIFGTAILKENLLMNVPCFIEEHLWMSVFNEATFKKNLLDVNPPQSWSGKQNDTTVVIAVMILEVVNNWKSVLQINIFKKNLDFGAYHLQLQEIHVTITILEWLVSTWHIYLTEILEEKHHKLSELNQI